MKLSRLLAEAWNLQSGATPDEVRAAEEVLGVVFPIDYFHLINWSNGGDMCWGERHFRFYSLRQVLKSNATLEIVSFMPGTVVIGGDASEILYFFDYRLDPASPSFFEVDGDYLGNSEHEIHNASLTEALYSWSGLTAARRSLLACLDARILAGSSPLPSGPTEQG
jgi:hypothetical protein